MTGSSYMICTSFPFCLTLALSPYESTEEASEWKTASGSFARVSSQLVTVSSSSATGLSSISLDPRRSIAKGQGRKRNSVYETKRAEQNFGKRSSTNSIKPTEH